MAATLVVPLMILAFAGWDIAKELRRIANAMHGKIEKPE